MGLVLVLGLSFGFVGLILGFVVEFCGFSFWVWGLSFGGLVWVCGLGFVGFGLGFGFVGFSFLCTGTFHIKWDGLGSISLRNNNNVL